MVQRCVILALVVLGITLCESRHDRDLSPNSTELSVGEGGIRTSRAYNDGGGHSEGRHGGGGGGGGGHGKKKKSNDLMSKILPMMVMPFLISSTILPMVLTSLKFMLLKSLFVGKIAILLIALNAFWRSENKGGVYSHNVNIEHDQKDLHMEHYGYSGGEEYGAYVNRRGFR